jgi:hypothetical protein
MGPDYSSCCARPERQFVMTAGGSWFVGGNIPGTPLRFLLYPRGQDDYRRETEMASERYEGFDLSTARPTDLQPPSGTSSTESTPPERPA